MIHIFEENLLPGLRNVFSKYNTGKFALIHDQFYGFAPSVLTATG